MFKKIIVATLAVPLLALAQKPVENNYVIVPQPGGVMEVLCQNTFKEYDRLFHTKTVVLGKPGGNFLIAINELLDNKQHPNRLMCSSSSQVLSNIVAYKDIDFRTNETEVLLMTISESLYWFVPNSNKATPTFKDQIAYWKSLNRPINVGYNFATAATVAKQLEKKHGLQINYIPFKTAPQIYPSLRDGSLDLALTVNGLDLAETGHWRWIGYNGSFDLAPSHSKGRRNFGNDDEVLKRIIPWLSIVAPKNSDPAFKKLVTERIKFIMQQPEFRTRYLPPESQLRLMDGAVLQDEIKRQFQVFEKLWE